MYEEISGVISYLFGDATFQVREYGPALLLCLKEYGGSKNSHAIMGGMIYRVAGEFCGSFMLCHR